jgi:small GTP-binding protein
MGKEEDIKKLEDEIVKTKYNKHTQYHVGMLKAKLAKLREEAESGGKSGTSGKVFSVKKSGDATVLLVGFPSVGKSTLINRITSADSKVGDYDFTTLDVIPGVMEYSSAKIQVLDIPGIVSGASTGRGRGKEILSIIRSADLILIMIENMQQLPVIERELYGAGFRLNERPPNVTIRKTDRGGINLSSSARLRHVDAKMIKIVMNERGIHNADVIIREDVTLDRLIDATCGNRVYAKALVVFSKADLLTEERKRALPKEYVKISSTKGEGIDELKKAIWNRLDLMRVYLKRIGKAPDMEKPLIIRKASSVYNVAERIHREFAKNLDHARIWGPSARFEGQKIGIRHVLKDEDVVELHMK